MKGQHFFPFCEGLNAVFPPQNPGVTILTPNVTAQEGGEALGGDSVRR